MAFKDEEHEMFMEWACGDKNAVAFLHRLFEASQIADDFTDDDAVNKPETMSRLLHLLLVTIPTNPFYIANQAWLLPVMVTGLQQWCASNEWAESEDENVQMFGYVYRESLEQVIGIVALLCGGDEHARSVVSDVNKFYHSKYKEDFKNWSKENG